MEELRGKTLILGVGAQKAGTSTLHRYLEKAPGICGAPLKEMHFFDSWLMPELSGAFERIFRRRLEQAEAGPDGPASVARHLRARVEMADTPTLYFRYVAEQIGDRSSFLDSTPGYSIIDRKGFETIRQCVSDVGMQLRILFVMRDPVDRYWSALRMTERNTHGKRTALDAFEKRIDEPNQRLRSRYDLTIENLLATFPEDHIGFGFYENIYGDPETHLRAITDFLGVEFRKLKPADGTPLPPSKTSLPEEFEALALDRFAPVYDYVRERFGDRVPPTWRPVSAP